MRFLLKYFRVVGYFRGVCIDIIYIYIYIDFFIYNIRKPCAIKMACLVWMECITNSETLSI